MKKIGFIAGISFLAGALFFALGFGFFQTNDQQKPVLTQPVVKAETVKITGYNFAPLVKKVKPAVVKVVSESYRRKSYGSIWDQFFNQQPSRERVPGIGSGFIISQDGYIITNNHVVENAFKVEVISIDEKEYKAKIIGTDPKTDLALLKINAKNLPFIQLGDSNKVDVGEWVVAIGNPLNQDLSVTAGIISAKGRQLGLAEYEDFLQTDAAINRGNSGGPLINMSGKVIGINSAILAPAGGNVGIGFAIPASMAKKVISDLKTKGHVVRGYLGVTIETITEKIAEDTDLPKAGVLVRKVEEGSPADQAGLKKYDLIVEANGKKVKKNYELSIIIAEVNPGDKIELVLYRKDKKKTVMVTVAEAPDTIKYKNLEEESRSIDLGMILVNNNRAISRNYRLKTSKGLFVKKVEQGSVAYRNNLRSGDVILEVNYKEVSDVDEFNNIISKKKPGSTIMLYVNRDGEEGSLKFVLPE